MAEVKIQAVMQKHTAMSYTDAATQVYACLWHGLSDHEQVLKNILENGLQDKYFTRGRCRYGEFSYTMEVNGLVYALQDEYTPLNKDDEKTVILLAAAMANVDDDQHNNEDRQANGDPRREFSNNTDAMKRFQAATLPVAGVQKNWATLGKIVALPGVQTFPVAVITLKKRDAAGRAAGGVV